MALSPSSRLGAYEVQSLLGEGGMGEVYRATDTNLKRQVALKVLPASVAGDAERLARFKREAEVLAALNHPHIAQIHGFEQFPSTGSEQAGVYALVMELVEGEDLSRRIARGPIPVDEAVPIARQIAEALEAAHEQGIVHRDLKPANIKIRDDGTVKVLDFGLAKALDGAGGAGRAGGAGQSELLNSPTITFSAATQAGMILGTAAYMAPEQAKGKAVDKRADIWAFGCVLYEMLCGKRAFHGDDVTDTLTAIMRDAPELTALPVDTPPAMAQLIARCLEKDHRVRLRDIGEARVLLGAGPHLALATDAARTVPPQRRPRIAWILAAVAILAAGVATAAWLWPRADVPGLQVRFVVPTPTPNAVFGPAATLALSPDGRRLAFVVSPPDGRAAIWIRPLDAVTPTVLEGTDDASAPFWSPDSTTLAFFADGKLKKIAATGGPVQVLTDAPAGAHGGTWSDDVIVFGGATTALSRVSAAGGESTAITTLQNDEQSHRWPVFLPGGRRFLYLSLGSGGFTVCVSSLDGQPPARLFASDSKVAYSETGHVLFMRGGLLVAQSFDAGRTQLTGDAVPLAEEVGIFRSMAAASFSVSSHGVLAFRTLAVPTTQLSWFDRAGRSLGTIGEPGPFVQLQLSPDGRQAAVQRNIGVRGDIWIYDLERSVATRFAYGSNGASGPVWSMDGRALLYYHAGGTNQVQRKALSAANETPFVLPNLRSPVIEQFSPDGRYLAYVHSTAAGGIFVIPTDGSGEPMVVRGDDEPQFSPDGKWLAYHSTESGQREVYVQSFPEPGERIRISTSGGAQPKWRGDSRELYYLTPDGMLMAVTIAAGAAFRASVPQQLFQAALPNVGGFYDQYGVTPDGQRFLVLRASGDPQTGIDVVVNWPAALRGR